MVKRLANIMLIVLSVLQIITLCLFLDPNIEITPTITIFTNIAIIASRVERL